jgi:hypothetical protein
LIALGIGFSVVCIWVAIRFGMLAVIVGFFVAAILITSPVVLDPQSWLFPMAALRLGLVALLIVYGAWPILATQPRQSSGMAAGA